MGGFALLNVAAMLIGAKSFLGAPHWLKLGLAGVFGLMGLSCLVLALIRHYANKPAPKPKARRIVTDPDELMARAREREKRARGVTKDE